MVPRVQRAHGQHCRAALPAWLRLSSFCDAHRGRATCRPARSLERRLLRARQEIPLDVRRPGLLAAGGAARRTQPGAARRVGATHRLGFLEQPPPDVGSARPDANAQHVHPQVFHPGPQALAALAAPGVKAAKARNIEDLRVLARRRLPRIVRDYVEGGAEDHLTLRANREALQSIRFAPRVLAEVSHRSLKTSLFGRDYDAPFGIAPIGAAGLVWHEADIALARAARAANVPFVLSTHSFVPLNRVAQHAGGPPWFQLYMPNNRIDAGNLVAMALDAGCEALVLTADVP